ncbi:annulin-like [Drosophila takahashii]|uniref:annulin-like n=1 Tax=Drosophila takahashii TaxID=29030 RepID=UPI001CF8F990|nr:annulin-like [Drosophila takahashii]
MWNSLSRPYLRTRSSSDHEDDSSSEELSILEVDLCLEDNHVRHHTKYFNAAFEEEALIVRRGDPFEVQIHFNRDYDPSQDNINFTFTVADAIKPSAGNRTLNVLSPNDTIDDLGEPTEWGAGIKSYDGQVLTVLIKPPSNCPVTVWKLDIDTELGDSYPLTLPIYVLFNPWCPDDQVYLEDRDQRKEYVLNDTTLIWTGSYKSLSSMPWKVGQYERDVLECSLKVLGTVGKVKPAFRGDPVKVARALSALVNQNDEEGILVGKWAKHFPDGVPPTKWTGSTEILREFYETKKPVKYAQCWVFGGVLATIARSLGIPARIITCFSPAHDSDSSLTMDIFVDKNNKKLDHKDSIWNFHVWNELWMQRPDLGEGQYGNFDGWQVVDGTPQEKSDEMYRLGPAPVSAVKNGEIQTPFDTPFVFAEVNADILTWRSYGDGKPKKLLSWDTQSVGKNISTKAVLEWKREDVTDSYKYAENTMRERSTMMKALEQTRHNFSKLYLNKQVNDIQLELELDHEVTIGKDFSVQLKITNRSESRSYVVSGIIQCDAILYNGRDAEEVKTIEYDLELQPDGSDYASMEVTFDEYFDMMSSNASFRISATATVEGTDLDCYDEDNLSLRKPTIMIQLEEVEEEEGERRMMDVTMSLENPLPIPLTKGMFIVEGPGIEKPLKFKVGETPVGGEARASFEYTPRYARRGTIVVRFDSEELEDVNGYKYVFTHLPYSSNLMSWGRLMRFSGGGSTK